MQNYPTRAPYNSQCFTTCKQATAKPAVPPFTYMLSSYLANAKPAETIHSRSKISLDLELANCKGC